jgi:bifunctional ADP-heptose synthase (sugar kinase/adenylyltransferase)
LPDRLEHLSGINGIDFVLQNKWPNSVDLIKVMQPDVYFKGQEYEHLDRESSPGFWLEKDQLSYYGGIVKYTYELVSSTTSIVEKVLKNHDINK